MTFLTCTLASAAFAQDSDEAFKKGLEARNKNRWQEAVDHMNAAIAAKGQESATEISVGGFLGLKREKQPYVPHFFAGEAYYKLNKCTEALAAWAISQQHGVVQKSPELQKIFNDGTSVCRSRGFLPSPDFEKRRAATSASIESVNQEMTEVKKLGIEHSNLWTSAHAEQFEGAVAEYNAALKHLSAGSNDRKLAEFQEADAAAKRASDTSAAIRGQLVRVVESLSTGEQSAKTLISQAERLDNQIEQRRLPLAPTLVVTLEKGRDLLRKAKSSLRSYESRRTPEGIDEVKVLASQGLEALTTVMKSLNEELAARIKTQLADTTAAVNAAAFRLDRVDELSRRWRSVFETNEDIADEHAARRKEMSGLKNRLATAETAQDEEALGTVKQGAYDIATALDSLLARIREHGPTLRERGVPEALENAATAFFSRDYLKTIELLSAATDLSTSAQDPSGNGPTAAPTGGGNSNRGRAAPTVDLSIHEHLFKAAALYELYLQSTSLGSKPDELLEQQAREEVERCKALDPSFQPDARAFSPRFRQFYATGVAVAKEKHQ
jgi:hypothetical protein